MLYEDSEERTILRVEMTREGLGRRWELSWALKGEILVNTDHAGGILGRRQHGWAPVRGTMKGPSQLKQRFTQEMGQERKPWTALMPGSASMQD